MWDHADSGAAHAGDPPWPVPSFSVNATGTRCLPLATVGLPKKEGEQISGRTQLALSLTGLSLQIWINTQHSNSQRPVQFLTQKKALPSSWFCMRRISMKHEYHCTIVFRYSTTRNRRSSLELFYAVWRRGSCALQALRADTYRSITHTFPDGKLTKRFFFCERTKQANVTAGQHTLSAGVWWLFLEGVVSLCHQLHSLTGSDKENKMLINFTSYQILSTH